MLKSLNIIAMTLALSACGGSGSDAEQPITPIGSPISTPTPGPTPAKTYFNIQTVEFLQNAEVCADENNNGICEQDEILGLTDDTGAFEIDTDLDDVNVIINAYTNQTASVQTGEGVGLPYSLIAQAPVKLVSPFTTLSYLSSQAIEDIAAQWQIDADLLSGNYYEEGLEVTSTIYVIRSLDKLFTDSLKNDVEIATLIDPITTLMEDINDRIATGEDMSELIIELNSDGDIVTNLQSGFIDRVDFTVMNGDWKMYHFAGVDEDSYAKVTIDGSEAFDSYCSFAADLNSDSPIDTSGFADCAILSFNNGIMNIGTDEALKLVYGQTTEQGTILIFKAETFVGINRKDDGYYWFDNLSSDVNKGESLTAEQWEANTLYTLSYDTSIYSIIAENNNATFKYPNGTEETLSYSLLNQRTYQNGLTISGRTMNYVLSSGLASENYGLFRRDNNIAISILESTELEFVLTSPNENLLETIKNGTLSNNNVGELSSF